MAVFGVVLAGGNGVRLGNVNKAKIRLGTSPLLDLVQSQLISQTQSICIAGVATKNGPTFPNNAVYVPDLINPTIGPLGGIDAGYRWAKDLGASDSNDFLLVVPVDTPNFPTDFVQHTHSALENADVVVARHGDQEYPTCSLWRIGAAANIATSRQQARNNSIRGYLDSLKVAYVDFAPIYRENPFKNVNKISDLIQIGARLH